MRRAKPLILGTAAVAIFSAVALEGLTRTEALRDCLRNVLAHELALALDREVAVGPVEGSLWRGLTIDGLAVAQEARLERGRLASATRARVRLSLWALVRSPGQPLAAIRSVELEGLRLDLVRLADGTAPGGAARPTPRAKPTALGVAGPVVTFRDAVLQYTDHVLRSPQGRPLEVTLRRGAGRVELGRLIDVARGVGTSLGPVAASGDVHATCGALTLSCRLSGDARGAKLQDLAVTGPGGERVTVRGVEAAYSLAALLHRDYAFGEALERLQVDAPSVVLVRQADGSLPLVRQIQDWLPRDRVHRRTRAQVAVTGGSVQVTDFSLQRAGQPLTARLDRLTGKLNLGRLPGPEQASPGPAGQVTATLTARCGDLQATAAALESDGSTRLQMRGLSAVCAGAPVASAQEVTVTYRPGAAPARPGAVGLEVQRAWANLALDERGWPTCLPHPTGLQTAPQGLPVVAFDRLALDDSDLTLTYPGLRGEGRPLHLHLRGPLVSLNLAALLRSAPLAPGTVDASVDGDLGSLTWRAQVQGDLAATLRLKGLRVERGPAEYLRAEEAWAAADLPGLLTGRCSLAGALRRVGARALQARLSRGADGRLGLVRGVTATSTPTARRLKPAATRAGTTAGMTAGTATSAAREFRAKVELQGATVRFADQTRRAGLNLVEASGVTGAVDFGRLSAARAGGNARGLGQARGRLRAYGPGVALVADLDLNLDGRLNARNLAVWDVPQGPSLRAAEASLGFLPGEILAGRWKAGVTEVALRDADANLVREADGGWRLARLAGASPGRRPSEGPDTSAFGRSELRPSASYSARPNGEAPRARVTLQGVRLRLTDYAAARGPLILRSEGAGLTGSASLARPRSGAIRGSLSLASPELVGSAQISTDLSSYADLTALNLAAREPGGVGSAVTAQRARVEYRLAQALAGDLTGALTRLSARACRANLVRLPSGELQLVSLARGLASRAVRQPARGAGGQFRAVVELSQSNLRYEDRCLPDKLVVTGQGLEGRVDVGSLLALIHGQKAGDLGWLRGAATLTSTRLVAQVALDADLNRRVAVSGLRVSEVRDGHQTLVVDLPRGVVEGRAQGLGGERPLEALDRLDLQQPDLRLVRSAHGELELVGLVREVFGLGPAPPQVRDWGELLAAVSVTGGRVQYEDDSLGRGPEPFRASVTGLEGRTPPGRVAELVRAGTGGPRRGAPGALPGELTGDVTVSWPGAVAHARLATDVARLLRLEKVELGAPGATGPRLTAEGLEAQVDLAQLLSGTAPGRSLKRLDAQGLVAVATRDAAGNLDLAALFDGLRRETPEAPAGRTPLADLTARLTLRDSSLLYTDQRLSRDGPVTVSLAVTRGDLDLRRALDLPHAGDLAGLGSFTGSVTARLPHGTVSAAVSSDDLSRSARLTDLRVRGGPQGSAASAAEAQVSYDLARAVDGKTPWPAALSQVTLQTPVVDCVRTAPDRVDLAEVFSGLTGPAPAAGAPAQPTVEAFTGRLAVRQGEVRLLDRAAYGAPIWFEIRGLSGDLAAAQLWAARAGRPARSIGKLQAQVEVAGPLEHDAADLTWDLDGKLALAHLSCMETGSSAPVVTLDAASVEYDPALALARGGDVVGALRDISLGPGLVQSRRLADRTFELPANVAAYVAPGAPGAASPRFAGGLRARLRVQDLTLLHWDRAAVPTGQMRVAVSHGSADVSFEQLAALHAGKPASSPGWLRGELVAEWGDVRAAGGFRCDLRGRLDLTAVALSRDHGARNLATCPTAQVDFDPAGVLAGGGGVAPVRAVTATDADAFVMLDNQGRWELLSTLRPAPPRGTAAAEGRFNGTLTLINGKLTYLNQQAQAQGQGLVRVDGEQLNGSLDFGLWRAVRRGVRADAGHVAGTLRLRTDDLLVAGRLDTDLAGQLHLWDTSVLSQRDGLQRELLAAREARATGDLRAVLAGEPWTQNLRTLELWDARGSLLRREDGSLDLPSILTAAPPAARPGAPSRNLRLAGKALLHGADLLYEDRSLGVRGGLLVAGRGLQGAVDLDAVQRALDGQAPADVGALSGSLAGRFGDYKLAGTVKADNRALTVTGFWARRGDQGPPAVQAQQVAVAYDLAGLLRGDAPLDHLSQVRLDRLRAQVLRNADGSYELAQGFKTARPGSSKAGQFHGRLLLTDCDLDYADRSLGDRGLLALNGRGLEGEVDVGALRAMQGDGRTRDAGRLRGTVAARVGQVSGSARLEARLDGSQVSLTDLRLATSPEAGGDGGQADAVNAALDLGPILAGRPWAEHVASLRVVSLDARLRRETDGRLRLARLVNEGLGRPAPEPVEPASETAPPSPDTQPETRNTRLPELKARVQVEDSHLSYTDEALLERGPLAADFTHLRADLDLATLLSGRPGPPNEPQALSARVALATRGEQAQATLASEVDAGIVLAGLSVHEHTGEVLRARRLVLDGDLGRLLRGERQPLMVVRKVELDGVSGVVKRDAQGDIVSPELLSLRRPPAGRPAGPKPLPVTGTATETPLPFHTTVAAHDVHLTWEDAGVLGEDAPLTLELASLEGSVTAAGAVGQGGKLQLTPGGNLHGVVRARTPACAETASFDTDLVSKLRLTDLRGDRPGTPVPLHAREVAVTYDWARLTSGRPAWRALESLRVIDAGATFALSDAGTLFLAGIPLGEAKAKDRGQAAPVSDLNATVTTDAEGVLRAQVSFGQRGELISRGQAEALYDPRDGWLDGTVSARRVDLALVGGLLLPADQGKLTGGEASLRGSIYGHTQRGTRDTEQGDLAWQLTGDVTDARGTLASLGEEPIQVAGPITATSEGVRSDGLQVTWGGVRGTVKGALCGLSEPVAALELQAEAAQNQDLSRLLPRMTRETLQKLSLTDRAFLTGTLVGPLNNADADLRLQSSGETVAALSGLGTVHLHGLNLAASALALADPSIRATLTARSVSLEGVPGAADRAPPGAFDAEPLPARGTPNTLDGPARLTVLHDPTEAGVAFASLPWATVRGVGVGNLQATARLADRRVEVQQLSAQVLGGELTGAGVVTRGGELPPATVPAVAAVPADAAVASLRASGRLDLSGARLAGLAALDTWPRDLKMDGGLNATVMGSVGGPTDQWGADLRVDAPTVQGKAFDQARAIVSGHGSSARVELAELRDGAGRLWARGDLEPTHSAAPGAAEYKGTVDFAAAELNLAKLPVEVGGQPLGGVAYLAGTVAGALDDPDLTADLRVFGPQIAGRAGDFLGGRVIRLGPNAELRDFALASGRTILTAVGTRVRELKLYQEAPGRGRILRPDGQLTAERLEAYAPMPDIARLAGSHADTDGWLYLSGYARGTLRQPAVNAFLDGTNVRFGEFVLDSATLPVSLVGDELTVNGGQISRGRGALSVLGRISDLYGSRRYTAAASLEIALEDIPSVQRLGLDVAGVVAIPHLSIHGSREAGPSGSALVLVREAHLGPDVLEPLNAWVQFGGGVVKVDATKIRRQVQPALPGSRPWREQGYVAVNAAYDVPNRSLDATLRMSGGTATGSGSRSQARPPDLRALPDVGGMLRLAAPVAQVIEAAAEGTQEAAVTAGKPGTAGAVPAAVPLSQQLASLGLRSNGKAVGELHFAGPVDDLNCHGRLSLWDAQLDGKALPRQVEASFATRFKTRELYNLWARASDGDQYLEVSGEMALPEAAGTAAQSPPQADRQADRSGDLPYPSVPRRMDITVEGAGIQLSMWTDWLPRPVPVGGTASFRFTAQGPSDAPVIKGGLDVMNPSYAGLTMDQLYLPSIDVSGGRIAVRGASLTRSEELPAKGAAAAGPTKVARTITMDGSLPWVWERPWVPLEGPVRFRAALEDVDLGFFPPLLDEAARRGRGRGAQPTFWSSLQATGTVSASLVLGGSRAEPTVNGHVTLRDGYVTSPDWEHGLEKLQLALNLTREKERNRAEVARGSVEWNGVRLELRKTWAYLDRLGLSQLGYNEYHADVAASSVGRTRVAGLTPGAVHGSVTFSTVPGPQAAPGLPPLPQTHRLDFHNLTADFGRGSLQLTGGGSLSDLSLEGLGNGDWDLRLVSTNADLRSGSYFQGRLNGGVWLHSPPRGPGAAASPATAPASGRARLQPAPPPAGPPVPRLVLEGALKLDQAGLGMPPVAETESALAGLSHRFPPVGLKLTLDTGPGVQIRGLGLSVPVLPARVADLTGTLQEPLLQGAASAIKGVVRVPTGTLDIRMAHVDYTVKPRAGATEENRTPLVLTGRIRAEGETTVQSAEAVGGRPGPVRLYVSVSGNIPRDIRVQLRAVPNLTEAQIVALLGAQPLPGLSSATSGGGDVLSEQALNVLAAGFRTAVFEPVEAELVRLLGLTEFSISFGFNQEVDLRIGKYLIQNLEVSYRRSIGRAGGEGYLLGLSYRLKDRLHVTYTTNELGESRVQASYDTAF